MFDAYAAGFIDGEGHICFRRRRRKEHNRDSLNLSIEIGQKAISPLQALHAIYGGTLTQQLRGKKKRPFWLLRVQDAESLQALLSAIEPHLILKRRRAQIALEFLRLRQELTAAKTQRAPMTKAMFALHDEFNSNK